MNIKLDIYSLTDKQAVSLIYKLVEKLNDSEWTANDGLGGPIVPHLANKYKGSLGEIAENIISRHPKLIIRASRMWNRLSPDFIGKAVNEGKFIKWLEENHANCFVAKFAGDKIEQKIDLYIKETDIENN